MRTSLLILAVVILASCSPQRRLARLHERFPPDTLTTIEYRDTTIYRDTTVYVQIPGDTIIDSVYIPIEIELPYMELMKVCLFAGAKAWVYNNHLGLELIQYDTIFQWKLDSALVTNIDTVIITNDIPFPVIEEAKPFYRNGFFILAGLILVGMILLFLFRKR